VMRQQLGTPTPLAQSLAGQWSEES
jgi:hypothetical protein